MGLGAASMITLGAASELRSSSRPTRQGRGKAKGSRLEVVMNQVMDIDKVCGVVKNMCTHVGSATVYVLVPATRAVLPTEYRYRCVIGLLKKKKKKKKNSPGLIHC